MIIGIDFGTCFSQIAFMKGAKPETGYVYDPNKTGIPSLFLYSRESQKELYGYECKRPEANVHSDEIVRYMKRTIRENAGNLNAKVSSGGKDFSIHEIVRKYLTHLIEEAKKGAIDSDEFSNTDIEKVTITAPIGIAKGQMTSTDYKELLINTIAEITGLSQDKVTVLEEPVAAAISYLYGENRRKKYDEKQTVLVFDLGGGTLDVTVVEHDPSTMTYAIKAKEGDLKLGGNDWDQALGDAVLKKIGIKGDFSSVEEKSRFEDYIERLKRDLTPSDYAMIAFRYNNTNKSTDFTRSEFENETKHLLDRAIAVTKTAINSYSSSDVSDIDKIILVGGSCNMPQIRNRMLSEFPQLGESRIIKHDPSNAIAKGAAVYAKMGKDGGVVVRDIVSHTYGFASRRSEDKKDMIYNLLFKGTPFGDNSRIVVKSETGFVARENSQTSIGFTVYESNGQKGSDSNSNWMEYGSGEDRNGMSVTVPIPPKYKGKASSYSCWVSFELDTSGVLEIIITDSSGNRVGYDKKQITL